MKLAERIAAMFRRNSSPRITAASVLPASDVREFMVERMAKQLAGEMLRSPEVREIAKMLPTLGFDLWRRDVFEKYAKAEVRAAMAEVQRHGVNPEAVLRSLFSELCRGVAN